MKKLIQLTIFLTIFFVKSQEKIVPFFKNGEAQIVDAFNTPNTWIRHDLWVVTDFDTD